MAKSKNQKNAFIETMRQEIERAQGILFVDYTGLTVQKADGLRRKLRESKVSYKVVKNTLMALLLKGTPAEDAGKLLKGTPTGVVLGFEDPVTPAKILYEYLKECEQLKIKGGIVDKKSINAQEAEALSKFPSKVELQGMVVGQALSPGSKIQSLLKGPSSKIVGAIEALVERLEKNNEPS